MLLAGHEGFRTLPWAVDKAQITDQQCVWGSPLFGALIANEFRTPALTFA